MDYLFSSLLFSGLFGAFRFAIACISLTGNNKAVFDFPVAKTKIRIKSKSWHQALPINSTERGGGWRTKHGGIRNPEPGWKFLGWQDLMTQIIHRLIHRLHTPYSEARGHAIKSKDQVQVHFPTSHIQLLPCNGAFMAYLTELQEWENSKRAQIQACSKHSK